MVRKKYFISEKIPDLIPQTTDLSSPRELLAKIPPQGQHIIANFAVHDRNKLNDAEAFRSFINLLINEFKLSKIGEVYHEFENGGFTGVVCLTESHLSIHTWPDQNVLTFDVFLSNFLRDNQPTTLALYHSVKTFFNASVTFEQAFRH
jgi:S-adenosylmethionine decarboxylase